MGTMRKPDGLSRPLKWLYGATLAVLVFSGFGQMPIFKRYYLADIPGMGWSADYHVTLVIHYLAVAVFLGLAAYYVVFRMMTGDLRPQTGQGWVRGLLLAVMIGTGSILLARNLSWVYVPPRLIVFATFTHVAGTMLFLLMAATYFRFHKKASAKENR